MGQKVTIEPFRDCNGNLIGDADEADYKKTHATFYYCGDHATLCGIPFVDEGTPIEVRNAINCRSCISLIEERQKYIKRNGKWY